jgi:flagellar hook-associated protein 3 FlgL
MALVSLGDMAQSFLLRRHLAALKGDAQTLLAEVATGQVSDVTRRVQGDFSRLGGVEASLSRLAAYRTATAETAALAGATQVALTTLEDLSADLAPALLTAGQAGTEAGVATAGADARARLESGLAALNSSVAGQSLLGAGGEPLPGADTILAALESATAGALTASGVEAAVRAWFDDPAGYGAMAGGVPRSPVGIAPGETVTLDITARDPGITDSLQALALAALLDRGALAGDAVQRGYLATRAGSALLSSQTPRAELADRVGLAEARLQDAAARNGAEASALGIARAEILGVDSYEAATRLEATQGQIETLYAITARISRLSLVDFLR